MNNPRTSPDTDWIHAFLPLGTLRNDVWEPVGGSVLLIDRPFVWMVTAREALRAADGDDLSTWVPKQNGAGLLNLSSGHRKAGLDWIHHPAGISACLFPADPELAIRAFSESQSTRLRDLQLLQPTASIGCLYGHDVEPGKPPGPAVCDGVISAVNRSSGLVHTTAPLLPRNVGAPLLLASPFGNTVTVAGIMLGNITVSEADPRMLPLRLGRAICIDAALELIRGAEATAQRRRITATVDEPAQTPPEALDPKDPT